MFSRVLESCISSAYKRARALRHEFMTVEHLMLGLLEDPSVIEVLKALNGDVDALRQELDNIIEQTVPVLPGDDERDTQPTLDFQRTLQRAVYHVQSSGGREVQGVNVLVAMYGEKDSHAVYFLQQQEITRLDVVNCVSHHIAKSSEPASQSGSSHQLRFSSASSGPDPFAAIEARLERIEQRLMEIEKKLGD